jgi:hypothetical protein
MSASGLLRLPESFTLIIQVGVEVIYPRLIVLLALRLAMERYGVIQQQIPISGIMKLE